MHHTRKSFLSFLFSAALFLSFSSAASAVTWQQPTAEELSMTSLKEVPGADAVYLYREESTDDTKHFHNIYVRLKILTEAGKEKNADVVPSFYTSDFQITDVQGRTIHSDGTVIPFTGKPFEKVVARTTEKFGGVPRTLTVKQKVFSLPDVQVGSILEYRYTLRYDDNEFVSPEWYIQQPYFVRSSHYRFVPSNRQMLNSRGEAISGLMYSRMLPPGADIKLIPANGSYELDMQNVPPIVEEEDMPPLHSLSYRVLFYYTDVRKQEEYWKTEGKFWSKDVEKFDDPSRLKDAVGSIVSPGDNDTQKVTKIYDAVMALDNTSFSREHTQAENRALGVRTKTAADIWQAKSGDKTEIALLFVGLARAAGLKAYAMRVTNRDEGIFIPSYLSTYQLDDTIAIVAVDGKEQFFDPGQRYCEQGQLHWKHTLTQGLRQVDGGTAIADTPGEGYKEAVTMRNAGLHLAEDGTVTGTVTISMTGVPALQWRHAALERDEADVKKEFEDWVQATVAPGVLVRMNHFLGMREWKQTLLATMDVSGNMGTATARRIFVPASFFEGSAKPRFVQEKRETPVDMRYASFSRDTVRIELPKTLTMESLPKELSLPLQKQALFQVNYTDASNLYTQTRLLVVGETLYPVKDYPGLRDFFQKVNAEDGQQLTLTVAASSASGGR